MLIAPARRFHAAVFRYTAAARREYCQYWPLPFVVADVALDPTNLIEGVVGQLNALVADREPANRDNRRRSPEQLLDL